MSQVVFDKIRQAAARAKRPIESITLVAVTKHRNVGEITPLYQLGCRDFGESRVQEALPKIERMPSDVRWHFIGPLQKNKVIKVIGNFHLIHSVDSPELAEKIASISTQQQITTPVLLQVNTSGEETKQGLSPDDWRSCVEPFFNKPGLVIQGLMTMAPLTEDVSLIRATFANLRFLRDEWIRKYDVPLPHLSMGMSHDFEIAIEEGATLIRIGTALFVDKLSTP